MASMSSTVGHHHPHALFMSASPASTSSSSSVSSSVSLIHRRRRRGISISMSASTGIAAVTQPRPNENVAAMQERVDQWMRESVGEIVKNLREAPLLVQLYPSAVVEKGIREDTWRSRMERWGRQESPLPVGLIFVERLPEEDEKEEPAVRAWGVVVQGAGSECGPVCYLLKTSGSGGPGPRCTHFCLMRVHNFRESALSQLTNCWLLR